MLKIAICDDNNSICNQIEDILYHYEKITNSKFDIEVFNSGIELVEYINKKQHFDLIFLDIEMEKMDGVKVGQLIRNDFKDYTTEIIYVSGTDSYYIQLFDVQPLNFISKPFKDSEIIANLDLAIERMDKAKQRFKYKKGKEYLNVLFEDILYLASDRRKIEVHMTSSVDSFYGKLKDILPHIPPRHFIQISRSIVVNYRHVIKFNYTEVTMSNNIVLPIAHSKRADVRELQLQEE